MGNKPSTGDPGQPEYAGAKLKVVAGVSEFTPSSQSKAGPLGKQCRAEGDLDGRGNSLCTLMLHQRLRLFGGTKNRTRPLKIPNSPRSVISRAGFGRETNA